ncbi:MAG: 3D domain-containing protein [Candidatus Paceibacterota bacterium]
MTNKNKILISALVLFLFLTGFSKSTSDIGNVSNIQVTEQETFPYTMNVTVTAYSSTPDQTDSTPFTTANGEKVRDGIMAANFLPFGTKVQIPEIFGDKVFEVTDRMHRRKVNFVDIWMPTRQDALNFGIKEVEIKIIELPRSSQLVLVQ